ncbi:MAG: 2-dehydropantoate 2-reductase [Prevotella sp.]|nr:2-dehydropantoate 2-reductase [Prevotella sp.]MBR1557002.1 2-dehydropantoate 2-reductase [Prevotella sp.]
MRYAVIGAGAIGGYYGSKLAYSGQEVHFLSHSDYQYVKANGFLIDSCDGSFRLEKVNVYKSSQDMPQCDVVIVGLKTINNHLLPQLLPPLLHEHSAVLLIQNGIGVEADVQQMFPSVQLIAGLAFICSAKTEPGRVSHQCYGSINLGNYSCRDEALFAQLLADFNAAGVQAGSVPYEEARWKKAVWNMPFNGMTVALDTQTDLLLKNPATRTLIKEQMMEVVGAARTLGVTALDEEFADKMIAMTDAMTPYSPSMKLDYDFHRPMEIHYLYSRPIQMAAEAGFAMPRLQMLEAELKFKSAHSLP